MELRFVLLHHLALVLMDCMNLVPVVYGSHQLLIH
jgi:hypothetical protein